MLIKNVSFNSVCINQSGRPSLDLNFMTGLPLDSHVTFSRSTVGTYIDHNGVMQSATSNTPRFDFDPISLSPRGLLIEEPRTNLITNSQAAGIGAQPRYTSVLSTDISPVGLSANVRKCTDIAGTGDNNAMSSTSFSVTAGSSYTTSLWVWIPSSFTGSSVGFANDGSATTFALTSANMTTRNQWQRISVVNVWSVSGSKGFVLRPGTNLNDYFYWCCPQFEAGSMPTSYIPTTGSIVARQSDFASINSLTGWFNSLMGTVVIDWELRKSSTSNTGIFSLNDGGINNQVQQFIFPTTPTKVNVEIKYGGAFQPGSVSVTGGNVFGLNKSGISWCNSYSVNALNGTTVVSNGIISVPSVTRVVLGTNDGTINGCIRRFRYWQRAIASTELQQLTT